MSFPFQKTKFSSYLLKWYDANPRAFPWRLTNDPYKIWLSEIMLQQTQVKTVIPYYENWLNDLSGPRSVASASLDYVLKKWEGLGYYARARNFHSACKTVINLFDGKIPCNYSDFLSLPGVGPYVAGAVMSIAYSHPIPAIDSNAYRVVSRIKTICLPFARCKNDISRFLFGSIPPDRPGDFNQAIMDLGREICTAKNPACDKCPVQKYCAAFVDSAVDKYPFKARRQKRPHYRVAVGVIWKKNKILITKRPERGLLGGLWEFPGGKIKGGEGAKKCIIREINEELGVGVQPTKFLKQISHTYTHYSITLDAYSCDYVDGRLKALGCSDWRWIDPKDVSRFPFPAANHKIFDVLNR